MKKSAIALVTFALAACTAPGDAPLLSENGDLADAAETFIAEKLVECSKNGSAVVCKLLPSEAPLRIKSALVGRALGTSITGQSMTNSEGACTTSSPDCPSVSLASFDASPDQPIVVQLRFEELPGMLLTGEMSYPGSSPSVLERPFEYWEVVFTRIDDVSARYVFMYELEAGAGFSFVAGSDRMSHIASLSLESSNQARIHLPVFPGSQPAGYAESIGGIGGDPHFTVYEPGCFFVQNGLIPFTDEGCAIAADAAGDGGEPPTDGEPPSDGEVPPATGPVCVEGSQFACDSNGGDWQDGLCCVENMQCHEGSAFACDSNGGLWTGSLCCVDEPRACVEGSSFSCDSNGGLWTGSLCCAPAGLQCVEGSSFSCDSNGGLWTGSQCCVEEGRSCTEGSSYSCESAGHLWTGSLCCES